MWFLISILFLLWIIAYITFGAAAYWVDVLLLAALVLILLKIVRRRRTATGE